FHQWFDLSGTALPGGVVGDDDKQKTPGGSPVPPDYGVTVMCDSKYGADKPSDNTVRLSGCASTPAAPSRASALPSPAPSSARARSTARSERSPRLMSAAVSW